MKGKKGFIIEGVELVRFNDGAKMDINDNESFCDKLYELRKHSEEYAHIEEYFNAWSEIYRLQDGSYVLYYTVPYVDNNAEVVDGYIVQSNNPIDLFDQLAVSRGLDGDSKHIVELIERAVQGGVILKQN